MTSNRVLDEWNAFNFKHVMQKREVIKDWLSQEQITFQLNIGFQDWIFLPDKLLHSSCSSYEIGPTCWADGWRQTLPSM